MQIMAILLVTFLGCFLNISSKSKVETMTSKQREQKKKRQGLKRTGSNVYPPVN